MIDSSNHSWRAGLLAGAAVLAAACSSDSPSGQERGPNSSGVAARGGGSGNGGDGDGDGDGSGGGGGSAFGNTDAMAPDYDASVSFRDAADLAPDEEGDCGGTEVEPMITMEVVPGNVLFIFDKSGSMCQQWSGGAGAKWQDAWTAVRDALTPLQDNVRAGAIFFPDTPTGNDNCSVPTFTSTPQIAFMDGPAFLTAWEGYWNAAVADPNTCNDRNNNAVDGATPLLTALGVGDAALASAPADGITNIVIITDGQPNCSGGNSQSDEPLTNLTPVVDTWLTAGYTTHVVGLPGVANAVPLLDGLALAGGSTQHIPANDPAALQAALAQIIGESVMTNFDSCRIGLPSQPPNLDDVVLTVIENGVEQSVARDLGTGGGWTIDPAGTEIVLQGLFCDLAREGQYDKIGVVFGCVELPPLPPPKPE